MSLSALLKEAGVSTKVSKENIAETPLVQETVVSPVDSPSATIPVQAETVVSTEPEVVVPAPIVEAPVVEPVVAPVAEVPVDVVTDVAVVDQLEPGVPVEQVNAIVADAVADVQVEATGELLEAAQCAIAEKADELLEIQTALENMTTIIRKTGANGVSNQTAEMIQLQLRSINRKLGVESTFVSTESFNARDPRAQHDNAIIALESIKTSMRVTKNKFVEIIERLMGTFTRVVNNYLDGVNNLNKKIDTMDQRLGALKKTGGSGVIELANAGMVMFNDSIDIPPDIKGLAHFSSVTYPVAVVKYLDASAKVLLKYRPDDYSKEEIDEAFASLERPLKTLIEQNVDKDELPGGKSIEILSEGLSFRLKGEVPEDITAEVTIRSTAELRKAVREIKAVNTQLAEMRTEVAKIDKAGKRLIEAGKRASGERSQDQESDDTKYDVVSIAARRAADAQPHIDEVVKYLVVYLNAQLAIVGKMVDAIEADKTND